MAMTDDDYTYTPRDTSNGYAWIKIRVNLLDDPKYMQLTDLAKTVYFECYLLAGRSDAGGLVLAGDDPATVQDLAWILRKADGDVQKALDQLQRAGLVDLTGDQVTVCRFASEQGPSMAEKREVWALRQAKRRALANGQEWHDPEQNPDADQDQKSRSDAKKEKNQDQKTESEADQDKTKIKRVTRTSRDNHAGVTRDSIVEAVLTFGNDVLKVWNQLHDQEYEPVQKFWEMVQYWHDQGVTIRHARQALIQTRDQAETPMYARELAVQIHNDDPEILAKTQAERFRELYRAQKQAGQADADQTGGDE